jgi:cellulose synthase/poly-beta-1,6-N-acetylglucosamine synthase-like glycosyltransferase
VSILVPVHNEEKNIEKKLENLQLVDYPKEKMEVIIVDDASDDNSVAKINGAIEHGLGFKAKLVKQEVNRGKAVALNAALQFATAPIIIVSDADTTWPADALKKAVPYLADPTVGAVTGQGLNKQTNESWVTKNEDNYLQLTSVIRLGESKIHSTIRFEGGFCAYKRVAFSQFDCESGSDDSGTALEVIQHNYRTILAPDVVFFTTFPTSLKGKSKIKVRRATQLIGLWVKCPKSMLKKQLALPKRIVIPEILLFIINPFVFVLLTLSAVASILLFPFSYFSLLLLAATCGLLIFARHLFQEVVFDNLLLFYASVSYLFGRRYVAWKKTN